MSGNPLAKYFPFIKKNAAFLFVVLGFGLYALDRYNISKTNKTVYSKNDFERRLLIENYRELIENKKI